MSHGPDKYERCPECAIDNGASRQAAFDMHFGPSADNTNPLREVRRRFVGDRADPTAMAELKCGHTVMA